MDLDSIQQINFEHVSPREDLSSVLKLLRLDLPRSGMMYNVVKLKTELGLESSPQIDVTLFMYHPKQNFKSVHSRSNALVMAARINVKGLPQNLIVLYSAQNPSLEILKAFERWVDWTEKNQFEGIEDSVATFLQKVCQKYGVGEFHDPIELYTLDKDDALRFSLEEAEDYFGTTRIYVKSLEPSDAKKVNSRWPAACTGSLEMLMASTRAIGSAGIFVQKSYIDDQILKASESSEAELELVSWAIGLPFGSIHALHTEEGFQRRGFATLTMKAVSKFIAETGRIPLVQIYKSNDTSKAVNLKVGFKYSHDINLIHYFPKICNSIC